MSNAAASIESESVQAPANPLQLSAPSWKYVGKRAINKFGADGCTDLAAALTYFGVLSLFPAILVLVSIVGLVGQAEETTRLILQMVSTAAGPDTAATLSGPLQQLTSSRAAGWTLALGIVTALWSASGYVGAFSRALNRIYGITEGRPIWKLRPALLLVTIAVLAMVSCMALLLVLSGSIARAVGEAVGLSDTTVMMWGIAKWPVLAALAIVVIAILYYFTPNVRQQRFRWISVGAGVALVSLVLASAGFGFYISRFSSYEKTYGTIAGMIVLLLWLWIMNLMLLLGAQIDAELERARQLQSGVPAEEELEIAPRDARAIIKKSGKQEQLVIEGRAIRRQAQAQAQAASGTSPEARTFLVLSGVAAAIAAAAVFRRRRAAK